MADTTDAVVDEIVDVVAASAPEIRAGLSGRRTKTAQENVSGERQLAADIWADDLLCERLGAIDGVATYASEEREGLIDVADEASDDARGEATDEGYLVAVDPLDGSSNLESNNPMGTVFGVYDSDELPVTGRDLVAAGFVLYGPITTMAVARDGEAREYVVGDAGGDAEPGTAESTPEETYTVVRRGVGAVELPDDPVVYGFGGRVPDWTDDFTAYVRAVEDELKLRYGGAMIADVSQVLTYGGIFGYPGLREQPEGKLRLLFEGAPIAYVVESAGGSSSDGTQSLLDVSCENVHQRTPVFVGNDEYVQRLESALD